MKRNKNLIELSRDHHHGLLLGWKIKQGFKYNVALQDMVSYIKHFSEEALFPHFDEEEEQLFIYLPEDDEYRLRAIADHQEIRSLIADIISSEAIDEAMLLNLANILETHIRFEEREMFPYMEVTLSEQQLEQIGAVISAIHQPYTEGFSNEFWVRK